jgi:hypothetical protein
MSASETQVGGTHYKDMGDFQPWDVLKHWLTPEEYRGYQKGVAIAYLARERAKGGDQDISKAAHHLQKLIEVLADAVVVPQPPEYDPASVALRGFAWIAWDGGSDNPVGSSVVVEVQRRRMCDLVGNASTFNWAHRGWASDIIAYRVVPD